MPTISRALSRGDWLQVFTTIRAIGVEHGELDPDEYAWHALRGLDSRVQCPDAIPG